MNGHVRIVGAGLAGAEAALTAARFGARVTLIDMKPGERTPAHQSGDFAEMVCSNSLKSNVAETAQGLLKRELRALGSQLIRIADAVAVPAGGALAVDRAAFSATVTADIRRHPNIDVIEQTVDSVEALSADPMPTVIATGPLTTDALYRSLLALTGGDGLHFFDAVAPIIDAESIDPEYAFQASRYGRGGDDYVNCPLDETTYHAFREALIKADKAVVHDFDAVYFGDCQPIEVLAARGVDTMRYGPLRPVGLTDPATGRRPYACLQLRREDRAGAMRSLVGCQTRLTFPEQRRVFGIIPALRNAVFYRYGIMHRNAFLKGPDHLKVGFQSRNAPWLFFAGQLSGLEGYVEAIASGLMAGMQVAAMALGKSEADRAALIPGERTMMGQLTRWVSEGNAQTFQPMNANFGLLPLDDVGHRVKKRERGALRVQRSDLAIAETMAAISEVFSHA